VVEPQRVRRSGRIEKYKCLLQSYLMEPRIIRLSGRMVKGKCLLQSYVVEQQRTVKYNGKVQMFATVISVRAAENTAVW
jgi:hypothetical protein